MPIDNSNSQSFRTHRLKCKAIAGTPGPLSNAQTVPESTFVDYKLGRTPYLVQPNGGPATVDAGCCGSSCPGVVCSYIIQAQSISVDTYISNYLPFTNIPVQGGFTDSVILITMPGCGQQFNITGLSNTLDGNISFTEINVASGVTPPFPIPPPFPATFDIIVVFPTSIVTVGQLITVTGTIEPCGFPITTFNP